MYDFLKRSSVKVNDLQQATFPIFENVKVCSLSVYFLLDLVGVFKYLFCVCGVSFLLLFAFV